MKIKSNFRKFSSFISHFSFQKGFTQHHFNIFSLHKLKLEQFFKIIKSGAGFTLIELLIVIAILGVLAAGILVAIDPVDKINSANDSKVQNDVSGIGRASEAYAALHNGFYPATLQNLVDTGELKRVPEAPSGYEAYAVVKMAGTPPVNDANCAAGSSCTGIIVSGKLKSKKYIFADLTFWQYQSPSGKSCAVRTFTGNGCG